MANEFIIKNGFRSQGNSEITGSLNISGSINTTSPINLTGFATGSVLFTSGSAGAITESSNLFWDNTNSIFSVNGIIKLTNPVGTNRSSDIRSSNSSDSFPTATLYPTSGTNVGQNFQIVPRGTGLTANVKAQMVLSGTDLIADGTNYEAMVVRATGTSFTFATGKGGTGTIRPLLFSAGFLDTVTNPNQFWLYSSGNVGINTTTDAGFKLDVNGTARVSNGITTTGADSTINATTGVVQLQKNGSNYIYINNDSFALRLQGSQVSMVPTLGVAIGALFDLGGNYAGYRGVNIRGAWTLNLSDTPDTSARLQVDSTNRGFLPPRMTLAQRVAISTPASGLIVYETGSATSEGIWVNETTGWQQLLTNTGSQNISGSLTVVGTSNLGGATFSNGGATFVNNVNVAALNEGSGNSWVNLNTTRVHLGQNGSPGGLNVTAATQFVGVGKMATAQLDILGNTFLTGSLAITSSAGTGSAIYAYKSGSTVLDIQGSQGQLFSVVDALSGSLMSVNDVSGLPILEVFSDDRIVMGTYGAPALTVSGSSVTVATASAAPSGTVPEGTFRFATVGGAYYIYAFIGGAWRSGSLS